MLPGNDENMFLVDRLWRFPMSHGRILVDWRMLKESFKRFAILSRFNYLPVKYILDALHFFIVFLISWIFFV